MSSTPTTNNTERIGASSLSIDWEHYAPYLDDPQIPDHQKEELITLVFEVVLAFADLGFDIAQTNPSCEQVGQNRIILPDDLINSLDETPKPQAHKTGEDAHHLATVKEES